MQKAHDDPPFMIGQPVWLKRGIYIKDDTNAYVVFDCWVGKYGSPMVEVVREGESEAPGLVLPASHFTTDMPGETQRSTFGRLHFTKTGRALRSIEGGMHV